MEVDELNKHVENVYVSVRKTDGNYYKKTSSSVVNQSHPQLTS